MALRSLFALIWNFFTLFEVGLSTFIHISYACLIVSTALAGDLISKVEQGLPKYSLGLSPANLDRATERLSAASKGLSAWWSTKSTGSPGLSVPSTALAAVPITVLGEEDTEYDNGLKTARNGAPINGAPIVLVHGIFGFGKGKLGNLSYWGGVENKVDKVLVPDLGSLASVHDRACELFYYLKGGVVDYGEEHSKRFQHSRFGRTESPAHYAEWDENHPVHFVAHSSGVPAVRLLQTMLAEKRFEGHPDTSASWVASITSLSGALNGTTRVYLDGISTRDGRSIRLFSLLQVLRLGVVLYEWVAPRVLRQYYSFGFDHFRMHWTETGLLGLFLGLLGVTGPFATGDWICPDLSIQSSVELNKQLETYPGTYYFSYATVKTTRFLGRTIPAGPTIHPLLFLRTVQIGIWKHPSAHAPPHQSYRDEDWQPNDGALNTISMLYPMIPHPHPHCPLSPSSISGRSLIPGTWYYTLLDADHIFYIISRRRAGEHFDALYDAIFKRCREQLGGRAAAQIEAFCRQCDADCPCDASRVVPESGEAATAEIEAKKTGDDDDGGDSPGNAHDLDVPTNPSYEKAGRVVARERRREQPVAVAK